MGMPNAYIEKRKGEEKQRQIDTQYPSIHTKSHAHFPLCRKISTIFSKLYIQNLLIAPKCVIIQRSN